MPPVKPNVMEQLVAEELADVIAYYKSLSNYFYCNMFSNLAVKNSKYHLNDVYALQGFKFNNVAYFVQSVPRQLRPAISVNLPDAHESIHKDVQAYIDLVEVIKDTLDVLKQLQKGKLYIVGITNVKDKRTLLASIMFYTNSRKLTADNKARICNTVIPLPVSWEANLKAVTDHRLEELRNNIVSCNTLVDFLDIKHLKL